MLLQNIYSLFIFAALGQCQAPSTPIHYGVVLYPAFTSLDVFGPLEALNHLSFDTKLNLSLIAATLSPVSTKPLFPSLMNLNPYNSSFGESVVPTHTFDTAPALDVMIIPGGLGTAAPDFEPVVQFVKERFPTLKYLITVCTGAEVAARAGVLDGKYATTNKGVWAKTIARGPKVRWVAQARWVQDGNIWSSSGVSAGIDVMIAFMEAVYGNTTATKIGNALEYVRHSNSTDDPFAELYGLTDANNSTNQN